MIDNDGIPDHINEELLGSYLNGDLGQDERKKVEAHLAECDACRDDLAGLRAVVDLLHQLPQYNPPRSFKLGPEHERDRKRRAAFPAIRMLPIVRTLSIAAVIAFLVVTGALVVNNRDNGSDKTGFTGAALAPQESNSRVGSGTGGNSPTSQSAEDESPSQAQKDTDAEQTSGSSQSLIDRGDAASADSSAVFDEQAAAAPPLATLTVTPSPQTSQGQGAPLTTESVDTSDDSSGTSWLATSIGLGILAIILIGLWLVLARMSKTRRDGLI